MIYDILMILPSMYFRVNLKMKKPTLCCRFTWIVFVELIITGLIPLYGLCARPGLGTQPCYTASGDVGFK